MTTPTDVLGRLAAGQERDLPVHGGTTLAYVYDSGLPEVDAVARQAVAAYAGSNGLDPSAFPSLVDLENDLVGFALDLVDGPDGAVGTVTSGGTESCLLAVLAARDARPEVPRPRMVVPSTVHAAFHKAAHYFGVELVVVEVGEDFRADVAAMTAALDEAPERTVLVVVSAPSYAHGVIDPVPAVAAAAAERGIRCHVDACIGGWVLPFAARLGRPVAPWTFAVPGVTSISMDSHKYGYAPKGTSLLLHRTAALRLPQFYATANWPGYTVINTTLQSTKSGGPLAGAWAVMQSLGAEGYLELNRQVFAAVDALVAGIDALPELRILARPDSSLIAFSVADAAAGELDIFTLIDEVNLRGWHIQPQHAFGRTPANAHLSLSAATLPHVPAFLEALAASVAAARASGPVVVDPAMAEFVSSLDVSTLSEEEWNGILAAAGMGAGDGLPERMAPINALINLATPATREAVVTSFIDQLSRPTR
ncbi:aminotransferase class V-fold PLP-dependent enzyme [Nocardioides sp.]|uniref:pyridoxal phosphate-dependent decarboxylase family protein n=1 Tax=Nocardioides sp. TaxID=35761 RepID=UPI00260DFE0F|nr:aminotransferase class V-fold PLP-dependent enzyme [Nocardioides sp.]